MNANGLACTLLALLASAACDPAPDSTCLVEGAEVSSPGLRYVSAMREDGGVRVRGFSGAVSPDAEVSVSSAAGVMESTHADDAGRFDISLSVESKTVLLTSGDVSTSLRVRDVEDALACVPGAHVAVGTTPNDVAVGRCGADLLAFVATSGDGALEAALLSGATASPAIAFPVDDEGRGANPWAVALHDGGERAAVALFGQHAVALVDPCAGVALAEAVAVEPDTLAPLVVEVSPPLQLTNPIDADGDGVADSLVSRTLARHPQGVTFSADRLFVTYSNLLEVGPPARYGPGLVVAFDLADDELAPAGHMVLPFQNPQSITVDDEGSPWVSCSGALERSDGRFRASSDGGLVQLDPVTLEVTHTLELGRFAPGTPAVTRGSVVVGSLLEGQVARFPRGATGMDGGQTLDTGATGTESLFEVASVGGGLALVTEFSTDTLHVVDVHEGVLHPWPFVRGIVVGPGDAVFRGLQAVARTPPAALTPGVPEGAALLGLSSEIVPLHLWQVMGP